MRNTTTYKITGAKTFRLGSSAVLHSDWFDGFGTNLQNIEKGLRRMYVADNGKCLVQCDQSGAEALVVAYLLKKGNKLREMFENKIKPHNYLGLAFPEQWEKEYPYVRDLAATPISQLKGLKEWQTLESAIAKSDDNPPATRYYYHYKQTVHSSNYGVRAGAFALNVLEKSGGKVALTQKQATRYLEGYHSLIPELREWWQEVETQLYDTHYIYNLFGFPYYFQHVNASMFKEAYAIIPQGTVGCITHVAYANFQSYIECNNLPWDLIQNNHDSYLIQCPPEDVRVCAAKGQEFLAQTFTTNHGTFTMKSEAQAGKNWSPYKKDSNPLGLLSIDKFCELNNIK